MYQTALDRFWAKVEKTDGCWLWTAGTDGWGYGVFVGLNPVTGRRRNFKAHRWIYAAVVGPIPPSHYVCHRCDVPACVRPDHLFEGTSSDNARDRETKGRGYVTRGSGNGRARLSEADVLRIRMDYAAGGESLRTLGRRYGLRKESIGFIISGKTWRHLPVLPRKAA